MILTRTPLRISFAGGGTDVPSYYKQHGGAVVSVTINKYIYITAKECSELFPHRYRLVYSQVEECVNNEDIKHPIIGEAVKGYGQDRLDLDVMSDVPAGTGLGSSSAFTVGLCKALGGFRDKHTVAESAVDIELNLLKEPIGVQDHYAAAFGGLNYFYFDHTGVVVKPISLRWSQMYDLKNQLILIRAPGTRSASALLKEQITPKNERILYKMSALATDLYLCLTNNEINELGYIVAEGWELKKELSPNVSTPEVDAIITECLRLGARGCKLLGAGGSGFVLAIVPDFRLAKAVRDKFEDQVLNFDFDMEGSKVLYED